MHHPHRAVPHCPQPPPLDLLVPDLLLRLEDDRVEDDVHLLRRELIQQPLEQELRHHDLVSVDPPRELPLLRQAVPLDVPEVPEEVQPSPHLVHHAPERPPAVGALPSPPGMLRAEVREALLARLEQVLPQPDVEREQRGVRQVELRVDLLHRPRQDPLHLVVVYEGPLDARVHVPELVHPAPPRAPRHLLVLARLQVRPPHAVELVQRVEDHRPRRHVDPQRERLRREDQLHQVRREHPLHDLLYRREEPRVVVPDPTHEQAVELLEGRLPDEAVPFAHVGEHVVGPLPFLLRQEVPEDVVLRPLLALPAREDEVEGRELAVRLDVVEELPPPQPLPLAVEEVLLAAARDPPPVLPARPARATELLVHLFQVRERSDPEPLQVEVVRQGHRPAQLLDHVDRNLPDVPDPRRELAQVRDRRREAHEADVLRREDDRLLPDRPALLVVDVVDLVEDDVVDLPEPPRVLEDRVAQDLRRHDERLRLGVDRDVAGEDADAVSVYPREVAELLVREGLHRGGVDDPPPLAHAAVEGVFGDERLSGARGRADEDGVALVEGVDRLDLEVVQQEAVVRERRSRVAVGRHGVLWEVGANHFSGSEPSRSLSSSFLSSFFSSSSSSDFSSLSLRASCHSSKLSRNFCSRAVGGTLIRTNCVFRRS